VPAVRRVEASIMPDALVIDLPELFADALG